MVSTFQPFFGEKKHLHRAPDPAYDKKTLEEIDHFTPPRLPLKVHTLVALPADVSGTPLRKGATIDRIKPESQ